MRSKKYVVGEDGEIELAKNIDYDTLYNSDILELNYEDKTSIYIIKTGKYLCMINKNSNEISELSCTIFKTSPMKDFLLENEMIKDSYSSDDIDKIIELYKEKNNI